MSLFSKKIEAMKKRRGKNLKLLNARSNDPDSHRYTRIKGKIWRKGKDRGEEGRFKGGGDDRTGRNAYK